MLKTLEEPPGDVRFVLASGAAHMLLPTIRSRCLGHTMAWPDPEAARQWLVEQGVDASQAAALLRAAGGRPSDALQASQGGLDPKMWSLLPKVLARGEASALANWAPAQAVDALQKVCHDLMAVRSGAPPRFFDAADLPAGAAISGLARWSRELARTARTVEHPFNAGLMLESLVSQAHIALNSRH